MNVFGKIPAGLREGKKLLLSTVIRTSGSVPAPLHSRMLVLGEELRTTGTVGGGCLDAAVLRAAAKDLPVGKAVVERFSLDDELGDTEFTCGGSVTILTERLAPEALPLFERLVGEMEEGRDCVIRTLIGGNGVTGKILYAADGTPLCGEGTDADPAAAAGIVRSLDTRNPAHLAAGDPPGEIFEFVESDPPLVIFGGGHVGKAIAESAVRTGFNVTVVEDRPEFATPERFPGARVVLCRSFDLALQTVRITPKTFAVIVTRGHRHDELLLGMCVGEQPRYLGMIGSRRKVSLVFEHLKEAGADPARLARVHAPIGLPIGAQSAGEIAVSVLAEMISVRRSSVPVAVPSGRVS
jgi:xanthine dehydrogenase accessory factor